MIKQHNYWTTLFLIVIVLILFAGVIEAWDKQNIAPQKKELTISPRPAALKKDIREDMLQKSQENLDRSISILNLVATLMAILVALITIIIAIAAACGLFERGRWKKIRQYAEENVKIAKKAADEALKSAEQAKPILDRLKEYEKEVEALRENIGNISISPESSSLSKELQNKLDEYGKKIEYLEEFGVPLKTDDYLIQGLGFYYQKKYNLALTAFNEAIKLKPDYAEAWSYKGVVLSKLGLPEEAIKFHEKAIELKPDYAEAWSNKGVALIKIFRLEEALKACEKAIELKPDYAEAWFTKACVYSLKGDKQNSLKNLSRVIELDPKRKEDTKKNECFKNLWDDEDFKRITSQA